MPNEAVLIGVPARCNRPISALAVAQSYSHEICIANTSPDPSFSRRRLRDFLAIEQPRLGVYGPGFS